MSLRRKIFYGLALFVVALLFVLPGTGWLVRMQWFAGLSAPSVAHVTILTDNPASVDTSTQETAARFPNDRGIQLAAAISAKNRIASLEALNDQFPHDPAIIAALLRSMTKNEVRVNRVEENLLERPSQRKPFPLDTKPSDPLRVARFTALAAEGEKLAPENAFFPMMATIGYFAAHQDAEALAAWQRASTKPALDDYTTAEIEAKWKLARAANHGEEVGAAARMASTASVEYPHYACLRASVRMVTVHAALAELKGEKETGFALRQATRQIGQRMVEHSKSMIGVFVGYSTVQFSDNRPGGEEVQEIPYRGKGTTERWIAERRQHYKAYLIATGHADEAQAFDAAIAQGEAAKKIWAEASEQTYFGCGSKTMQLFGATAVNALLLTAALFSLAFGGIFKLVYALSPRLQRGEALQNSARWGVAMGIAIPLIALASLILLQINWSEGANAGLVLGILLVAAPPVFLRLSLRQIGHGLLVALASATAFVAIAIVGAFAWRAFGGVAQLIQEFYGYTGTVDLDLWKQIAPWVIGAAVLVIPLGMLLLFAAFSRRLRVPLAAGITRGMRATAVPLAAMLVLLWAGTFLCTLNQEYRAIAEQKHIAAAGELWTMAGIINAPLLPQGDRG